MKKRGRHWLIAITFLGFFVAAILLFENFLPAILGLVALSLLFILISVRASRKKRERALKIMVRLISIAQEIQRLKKDQIDFT